MKKKLAFTVLAGVFLALTACGNNKTYEEPSVAADASETSVPEIAGTTEIDGLNESTGSMDSLTEGNVSRRIEPLPATLNMDALDNCTVAASFQTEDAISQEETLSLHMTVYDYELFDLVDVSLMSAGDTLVIDGVEILIQSVDRSDNNLVFINGGFLEGGYDLYTEEHGVYYEVRMDIGKSYYSLGDITLPIAADFVFTDDSDLGNPGKAYDTQEFWAELAASETSFNEFNTKVTIQDGSITNIHRIYMP